MENRSTERDPTPSRRRAATILVAALGAIVIVLASALVTVRVREPDRKAASDTEVAVPATRSTVVDRPATTAPPGSHISGPPKDTSTLTSMTSTTDPPSSPAGAISPRDLSFVPSTSACTPTKYSSVPGSWQTSVDTNRIAHDIEGTLGSVKLGLRSKYGTGDPVAVKATIVFGRQEMESEPAVISADDWAYAQYPAIDGGYLSAGTYTVVWTTARNELLACTGFVLR